MSFNYSLNFEIRTAVPSHTISFTKKPCDINLKAVFFNGVVFTLYPGLKSG